MSEKTVRRARISTSVPNGSDVEAASRTGRAKAAIVETPDDTNVAIATYAAQIEVAGWMG